MAAFKEHMQASTWNGSPIHPVWSDFTHWRVRLSDTSKLDSLGKCIPFSGDSWSWIDAILSRSNLKCHLLLCLLWPCTNCCPCAFTFKSDILALRQWLTPGQLNSARQSVKLSLSAGAPLHLYLFPHLHMNCPQDCIHTLFCSADSESIAQSTQFVCLITLADLMQVLSTHCTATAS